MTYKIENIEMHLGDCQDVLRRLALDTESCVFVSDPPYNIGYHYEGYSDRMPEGEYFEWLKSIFGNYRHVLIHYPEALYRHSFNIGVFPDKIVSWVYNSNTAKQHRDIAFFGIRPDFKQIGQPYKNPEDKRIAKRIAEGKMARLYDWWNINQVKNVSREKTSHPCQIPLKVMENIIGILPPDMTIVDPFMGSGTTALAAQNFGRKFIGIENHQPYFEAAINRVVNNSGKLFLSGK